ncbi:ABC transporter substrate-binding protein [Nonlabens xiamenensis]|uniref:ABC transporter substrate-binding protein n=1 Tax=Nonlabens xiamenensis TaxID=2341043 RepID=UPI000F60B09D|nr:helical backbone metal receptor [Nonlabens xiamenensis]
MFCKIPDQMGRIIALDKMPQRIISLVPSQTELLIDLGLRDRLVGITRYCVHPNNLTEEITVVGGTKKTVNSRILDLQPDLIIANKEENTAETVSFCDQIAPTYVSDIDDLEQALDMIKDLGTLTGSSFKAKSVARKIRSAFNRMPVFDRPKKAVYLIWKDPYMSIGQSTFINDMLQKAGFENLTSKLSRYPSLQIEDIIALQPEVVLLSSEPYPFTESDAGELREAFLKAPSQHPVQPNLVPEFKIVDGEMFSWYGSRLLKAPDYFIRLQQGLL